MITAKEMNKLSLKARYKKYGGKAGFRKFMIEQGRKGGQAPKKKNLTA